MAAVLMVVVLLLLMLMLFPLLPPFDEAETVMAVAGPRHERAT